MTSTGPVVDVPFFVQMCEGRPITTWNNCEPNDTHERMQTLRTSNESAKNLYYKVMRVFAGSNVPLSIITIRLISCLLAALLLFGFLSLATGRLLVGATCSLVFTLVPNALVLVPMATSKSWALIGSLFGWIFLAISVQKKRGSREQFFALGLLGLCIFLVISSRIDATVFLIFSCIIVSLRRIDLQSLRRTPRHLILAIPLLLLFVILSRIPRINSYISSLKILDRGSVLESLLFVLNQVFETLASSFGYWVPQSGAGPGIVGIIGIGLATFVIGVSLQNQNRFQILETVMVLAFLVFVIYWGNVVMGPRVPGTYTLALTSFLIGITVLNSGSGSHFLFSSASRLTIILLISATHLLSLRGRTYGYSTSSRQPDLYMPWINSVLSPSSIVVFGASALTAFLVLAMKVIDIDQTVEFGRS